MSVFEIGMLLSFGFAWPISIYKSWVSKSNKGKSLLFVYVIFFGYIFGVLHKIFFSLDIVLALYCINLVMVAIDLVLYYRNKKILELQT